jgi:hypothetical protein
MDETLMTSQKNEVLDHVLDASFDAADFKWEIVRSTQSNLLEVSRLAHREGGPELSAGWSPPARSNWFMKANSHRLEHVAIVKSGESKGTGIFGITPIFDGDKLPPL